MKTTTRFRAYEPHQTLLLPPSLRDWLPEDHLAYFIMDVVDTLDLSPLYAPYASDQGGQPAYEPSMMLKLLFYGYCMGERSSRGIERLTYESVPYRVITADQHPDHSTIAEFRKRHLKVIAALFLEILQLCREAGLVKLGHVAIDGSKLKANASKHKAMSYDRMEAKVKELDALVARLLAEAQAADAAEDAHEGCATGRGSLPEELRFQQGRLAKLREAKRALEDQARAKAEQQRQERAAEESRREAEGRTRRGPQPQEPSDTPEKKAQRNFTDPDSRIMKDGATHAFTQAYNCQAAVDADSQVIVAALVTQASNDKQQLQPVVEQMQSNLGGAVPSEVSADAGYFSEANVTYLTERKIDGYIATGRKRHGVTEEVTQEVVSESEDVKEQMERKLRTVRGRATYSKRKETVEPVFGQIKSPRGIRQFLLRGLENVRNEWALIAETHNLLKLFRSGWRPSKAAQRLQTSLQAAENAFCVSIGRLLRRCARRYVQPAVLPCSTSGMAYVAVA
jgi:transposase